MRATLITGLGLAIILSISAEAQTQTPLPASKIPQFVDPLPIPPILNLAGKTTQTVIEMREFETQVLPTGTFAAGKAPMTWVWGYVDPTATAPRNTYLGPIIIAQRGIPTEIKYVNKLGSAATTKVLAYKNSTDQTLHWADPLMAHCHHTVQAMMPPTGVCAANYNGPIPAVTHLHGGEVPSAIDGGPDQWFTSDVANRGTGFYSKDLASSNDSVYRYPNSQEGAPLWFHDHTLGVTRLNVYAGLAGGYILTDPPNDPKNLPALTPLIIQDRMFDTNGQLYFPATPPLNPEHPYWIPEFVGDAIAVNGRVWPYMNVQARRYRFLILNGSNARTYELFLSSSTGKSGPAMYQIATDGGYLDFPVKIDPAAATLPRLVLMPGERAEVIIDFKGLPAGTRLILRNNAKTPYPNGAAPNGATTGRVMEFRVTAATAADTSDNPALGIALRTPMVRLANAATGAPVVPVQKTRQLTLNEVMGMPMTVGGIVYPGGPLEVLVNNTKWSGVPTETPKEGDTEVWEIVNLTADAHPIHLHLVQFQLLNRQRFDVRKYTAAYNAAFGGVYKPASGPPLDYTNGNLRALGGNPDVTFALQNGILLPAANEAGWKDTILVPPGQVTRFIVRWAPTTVPAGTTPQLSSFIFDPQDGPGYVWHCHIIDHEDNEMMRPTQVIALPGATRTYAKGTHY